LQQTISWQSWQICALLPLFEEHLLTTCQHYTIDKVQYISLSHETIEILSDIIFWFHSAPQIRAEKISGPNVDSTAAPFAWSPAGNQVGLSLFQVELFKNLRNS